MNKVFHEKFSAEKVVLLVLQLLLLFFLGWQKNILAIPILLLVLVSLERLLHCTYTITSQGTLIIDKGRFGKYITLDLQDIHHVEYDHYLFNIGIKFGSYVLLVLKDGKQLGIRPEREQEFITYLENKQTQIALKQREDEEID